jgi:hypothetical protein
MHEALTNRIARIVAAAVVLVLAGALIGCGSDDEGSDGENDSQQNFPPHVVRDSDIEAQDSGSPERALLEWWQAFQFGDAAGVRALTSPATVTAIGPRQLAELVEARGSRLQGLEVLGSTETGGRASVRAALLSFQRENENAPPPTAPTASRPTTFMMEKRGDEWLFRETAYLEPMVEELRKAKQQESQQQQQTETQTEEQPLE